MKQYGWFEFETNPIKITNYLTAQSLEVLSIDTNENRSIHSAYYFDTEIEQHLNFTIVKDFNGHPQIYLDYSTTLSTILDYWVWRRIDDFVTDALLCWPEYLINETGFQLIVNGAWIAGAWHANQLRRFSGRKSATPRQMQGYIISEPYKTPCNILHTQNWELVPVENPAIKSNMNFDFLDGSNIPFLAHTDPVQGFQGDVPYLIRADGKAHIVFAEMVSATHRGEDPETHIYYTYVDEEIFFTFRSHPFYRNEITEAMNYGFRQLPPKRDLWTLEPLGKLISPTRTRPQRTSFSSHLSYPTWLKVSHSLADAWHAWERQKVELPNIEKIPDSHGKYGYIGNYGPTTHGGFTAGMVNSWYEVRYFGGLYENHFS